MAEIGKFQWWRNRNNFDLDELEAIHFVQDGKRDLILTQTLFRYIVRNMQKYNEFKNCFSVIDYKNCLPEKIFEKFTGIGCKA